MSATFIQEILDAMLPPPSSDPADPSVMRYRQTVQSAMVRLAFAVENLSGDDLQRALYFRNAVGQRLTDMSDMYRRATAAGLFFSSDPVDRLRSMARGRSLFQALPTSPEYVPLYQSISALCTMLNDEKTGVLDISSGGAPRIGSLSISFEGMRGIPSSVFNADSLKKQQANVEIQRLDFSKRRGKLLFVAERDEDTLDLIIGVRRMRDASGYIVKVVDKRSGRIREVELTDSTRDDVASEFYSRVMRDVVESIVPANDVMIVRVPSVERNSLHLVTVRPYQRLVSSRNDLFRIPLDRMPNQQFLVDQVERLMADFTPTALESVTPYPFISDVLFGDRRYGWMLAGLNLLSSFERGDSPAVVRGYSYLGAKMADIRQRILDGSFYVPHDLGDFVDGFSRSMSDHGLRDTLSDCLEKSGMFMFFDGREGFDVNGVTVDQQAAQSETSIVSKIISVIDPVHAVLLPSDVRRVVGERASQLPRWFLVTETIPDLDESDDPIDVTTFVGMSRLMNVIVDASRGA